MSWHADAIKKFITEYKKEIAATTLVILLLTVFHLVSDRTFQWRKIEPFPEPTLTMRLLSALVFDTFGLILYRLKFYYVLYIFFVVILRSRELFYALKKIVWFALMFIMGFWVAPWFIDTLNSIVSIFYNSALYVLYLFTPYGASMLLIPAVIAIFYYQRRLQERNNETKNA
jgi:hypothetical protein